MKLTLVRARYELEYLGEFEAMFETSCVSIKEKPEPIVLVIFNIKSARYLVLFAGKSTR